MNINISLLAPSYVGELKHLACTERSRSVQSLTQKTPMKNLITTSKSIAFISFIIGTILFALQMYNTTSFAFVYPGILFIIIAFILNTITFLALGFSMLGSSTDKTEILKTIGIVLLNIPIAFIYFYILIEFL